MARYLVIAFVVFSLLLAGCRHEPASAPKLSSPVAATQADYAQVQGSIPSLALVASSDVPHAPNLKPGDELPIGDFKPFLRGDRISSVTWAMTPRQGSMRLELQLSYDDEGSRELELWSKHNIGKPFLVLLGRTLLARGAFKGEVGGGFTMTEPYVVAARSRIDAATIRRDDSDDGSVQSGGHSAR